MCALMRILHDAQIHEQIVWMDYLRETTHRDRTSPQLLARIKFLDIFWVDICSLNTSEYSFQISLILWLHLSINI